MQNLPSSLYPKFEYEEVDKGQIKAIKRKQAKNFNKTVKKLFERSLNSKNIVKDLALDHSDYMDDTNNSSQHDLSSIISLQPGVNLNGKGKTLAGPAYDRKNRMTLQEYAQVASNKGNSF